MELEPLGNPTGFDTEGTNQDIEPLVAGELLSSFNKCIVAAAVIMAVGSLYFAWRNRDFRKFLAGAFFVSSGILFYLYLADVSVPLLGTSFVEKPQISGGPSIVHFILFLLCFYFGFVSKPKA